MNPATPDRLDPTIDPSIQTRLMIIVERAVRPVEACTNRKKRMREELLAHVTTVYEEEAATPRNRDRDRDSQVDRALERTRQRFGDPAALTEQLQQSVPRFERWSRRVELSFMARRYSAFQLAWRCAAMSLLVPGLALLAVLILQRRLIEAPVIVAVAVIVFGFVMLLHKTFSTLFGPRRRSWIQIAMVGIASWIFVPGVTCLLGFIYSGDWSTAQRDLPGMLAFSLMTPLVLLISAWAFALDLRSQQPWTSLAID